MLVHVHVGALRPQELDAHVELILAAHAVGRGGHLFAVIDRVAPSKERNERLNRILSGRQAHVAQADVALAAAVARAGKTDVARQNRQHGNGACRLFTVGLTLRTIALGKENRFGLCHFTGQPDDSFRRNAGDAGGVFRSLWRLVFAFAQNVALVVALGGRALGQRLFVVAHAVFVEEGLIDQVFLDHDVGDAFNESRIGTRTDRHPFVFLAQTRVRIDRIDNDHARTILALTSAIELPGLAAARLARDHRVVAEGHVELSVADFGHLRAAGADPVGVGEGAVDLSRRVGAVAAQRTAQHIE